MFALIIAQCAVDDLIGRFATKHVVDLLFHVRTAQAAASNGSGLILCFDRQAGYLSQRISTFRSKVEHQLQERQAMTAQTAYKILTASEFEQLQHDKIFSGSAVDIADGYIHLSTGAQVTATLDKYFSGIDGLMIAAVDLDYLGDAIRWEPSRGGDLFPHLYELLPLNSVVAAAPVSRTLDGLVSLPALPPR